MHVNSIRNTNQGLFFKRFLFLKSEPFLNPTYILMLLYFLMRKCVTNHSQVIHHTTNFENIMLGLKLHCAKNAVTDFVKQQSNIPSWIKWTKKFSVIFNIWIWYLCLWRCIIFVTCSLLFYYRIIYQQTRLNSCFFFPPNMLITFYTYVYEIQCYSRQNLDFAYKESVS